MFTSYAKPLSAVLFCLASVGTYAHANTITDLGSTYSLSYQTTAYANKYKVNLIIDTSHFNRTSSDVMNAVSLVLATTAGNNVTAGEVSNPMVPAAFNQFSSGGASSGKGPGCDGTGTGFCFGSTLGVPVAGSADTYAFDFLVSLPNGVMLSSLANADHVKAVYVKTTGREIGKSDGLTSQNITLSPSDLPISPVPEPSTLLLMATGLIGFGLMFRRQIFTA
jgi:hypothetical protein